MKKEETEKNLTEEMRAQRRVTEDRQTLTQILTWVWKGKKHWLKKKGDKLKRLKKVMGEIK